MPKSTYDQVLFLSYVKAVLINDEENQRTAEIQNGFMVGSSIVRGRTAPVLRPCVDMSSCLGQCEVL